MKNKAVFAVALIFSILGLGTFSYKLFKPYNRMPANETSAIGSLRTFLSAQATYMNRNERYASIKELFAEGLIDNNLARGKKNGYLFGEVKTGSQFAYMIVAVPIIDGKTGEKEFLITQRGTIFEFNIDSSGKKLNLNGGDIDWSNPKFNIPKKLLIDPDSISETWTPTN